MRPRILIAVLATLLGLAGSAKAASPTLDAMERAADWQLEHPSTKCKPTDWENAAFYAGVMALTEVSQKPRYVDAMVAMGEANHWQLGVRPYHADDHAVGQTYIDLYRLKGDPRMIRSVRERFDFILANPKTDTLVFDKATNPDFLDRWSWCDALFMAPPAWAKLAAATGDSRYLDYAISKWWVTSNYLYDHSSHLYYRDSTFFSRREANGAHVHWARGNGWVLAGLVRMLGSMPKDHPDRVRFLTQFREMAEAIAALQNPDGFWRASLLDPQSYPMQESSGTGFFCYGLAWGISEGILDPARYRAGVDKAWAALLGCEQPDGKLTHVQPVGSTPVHFDPDSTEPYGVGAFLLAGREVLRLESRSHASDR
jgi:unsaturated rhamnogalacturonyl hydrolase